MMKFARIIAVAVIVFCANFVFAQEQNTNVTATGGSSQSSSASSAAAGAQSGVTNNITAGSDQQRIVAPLLQRFVDAPTAGVGRDEVQLSCDPAYRNFSLDELRSMADSGRFLDKRGSFFDAALGTKVKSTTRVKIDGKPDGNPVRILDRVPVGAKVLGEFQCFGDYGWPLDETIGKCLLEAKEKTNTSDVVVWWGTEIDAENSGTAYGAGAAISGFSGNTAGAGSLAPSFGSTYSQKKVLYKVRVRAYADVGPQPDVCGGKATEISAVKPAPKCDQETIQRLKKALDKNQSEINKCKHYGLNNLRLRNYRIQLYWALYGCTGDKEALHKVIQNGGIASRNYKFGSDIKKNRSEADRHMNEVTELWAKARKEVQK